MNYPRPEIVSGQSSKNAVSPSLQIALPRVSVIVTCFNYSRYIIQCLDSVKSQTYENFDCVIVDDASTDDSGSLVERWIASKKDPRFRLIRNASNSGQSVSFTVGLVATNGEFVAFLDADDFWFPEFLQRHIEAHLNRSFSAATSCSDMVQIDDEGRVLSGTWAGPQFGENVSQEFPAIDAEHSVRVDASSNSLKLSESAEVKYIRPGFLEHPWSATSGMVFRRSALDLVMPKTLENLRICTDGYIFVICHYFTGSLAIGSALGAYRRHGQNNFSNNPVLGHDFPGVPTEITRHLQTIVSAMLGHLLDNYDRFAAIFSDARVRGFVDILFRTSLQNNIAIKDPRLRRVLGRRRMFEDKMKAKLSVLRRLAPWRTVTRAGR